MRRPATLLLLLVACSPPPKPVPEARPAPTPAPTSDVAWWCTCYMRSGPLPVTSCRKDHADCRRIERLATEGGGSAIVPGSLTHRCREVRGDHPGDVLGDRGRWDAVEKSGSWVSQGACLLPGPPDAKPPPAPSDIHTDERLGGLVLGMSDADVRALLGDPASASEPPPKDRAGHRRVWQYPDRGLTVELAGDSSAGPWRLDAAIARPPCDLRTSRGVGVGDPQTSVEAAYLKDNPFPMRPNATSFIAAAPAHTLQFDFDPNTRTLLELRLSRRPEGSP